MNVTSLLLFESMKYSGAQTQAASINQHVAQALRVFIEDFYQRIAPAFIVILSCRRPSPMNFYRNIMQLLYESVDTMIIQLVLVEFGRPRRIEGPRTHNLLLVDSLDALLDIEIHTYTAMSDGSEYYFIFLQQRDALIPQDMQGVFAYCWRHQLINCNVMTQSSGGQVLVHTYFPYAPGRCNNSSPARINQFLGPAWQSRDYFPSKLRNLHGCQLVVLARRISPFFEVDVKHQVVWGLEGHLLKELSRRMNFSIMFDGLEEQQRNHTTWTEQKLLQQMVQGRVAHLAIGYVRKHIQYSGNLTAVFPHYSNRIIGFVLLNAHNLTSLEIWSFPFQALAWVCLVVCFLIISGLVMIYFRQTVGGFRGDRLALLLAVYAASLGLPVEPPERVSMQLLFASWLCFTLVVRAMYGALLFLILRYHLHQRLPDSLQDLVDGGYTAIMSRTTLQDLREVTGFQNILELRTIVVSSELEEEVLRQLERFSERDSAGSHPLIFGLISQDALLQLAERGHRAGAYHMVSQQVLEQQLAIYLQKHSHLAGHLDHLVMSIRAVGLLHHWAGQVASERYFRSRYLYREKRIRQSDLWAVYVLVGALYICSVFAFIWEVVSARRWPGGNVA
ncbi:uncharacterized protein Dana_GF21033 [Drosophila ananassae]|uniref:Putative ionotropic receptor ligand binding domain-containing protein n=1 Tax=Drosophila ananassae TaxID=7217 RepID=B3MRA4_DROAN|nr:uncharacterized protein LOC6503722 [Drosophila ananassae]EDV34309.2 uncharacterized protein Dana_GF21033 [Drosophila ananassae]